ncbi:hypothetical protein IFM89_024772 [Coptis chinensis]|uniref:procollagen-proline 4-dioxygenase n=1 Tax=Coptis chinensis TaxID=261450 RepID=A0A835HJR1_9MAGN|nr:hypothetical protein IFM89_024772 [Coptis chinensis]
MIEDRISGWTFLPKENSEPMQIMHYVHEDTRERIDYYGDKARLGFDESLMATVVLYLSNVSHGGETFFRKSKGKKWCATKYFYLKAFDRMKISLKSDSDECTDEEDSCPEWAAQGECNRNPTGSQADSSHQQQHNSQFLLLSRQTSFYNLTLDEVQNQLLGKPLESMNLDKLLKNVCTAEDKENATSALHH